MPKRSNAESPRRRIGKFVNMTEQEVELLEALATRLDRSAASVIRVAVKRYAGVMGVTTETTGEGEEDAEQ